MRKKLLALTLAGAMCAGVLAGCGGGESGTDAPAAGTSAEGDQYNVAVIVKLTDGHFNKVIAGAQAYAAEHDNVTVEIQSPTSATAYDEQLNMIETALANSSIDAAVIAPLQSESASTLVANTDKPVVALDTDFTSDKKASFVGTGNEEAAKQGGQAAVEAAKAKGKDKPTVVIITGAQGDETHEARLRGYKAGAEAAGGEVIEVQYADAMADRAVTAMEGVMQKNPNGVDVVLSTNDDMAMAVSRATKSSNNAAYADLVICGFDGNQSAIEAIQAGELTMDVAQLGWDMGYKAVEAVVNAAEGKQVESFIDSGSTIVTADNLDAYVSDMKAKGLWE